MTLHCLGRPCCLFRPCPRFDSQHVMYSDTILREYLKCIISYCVAFRYMMTLLPESGKAAFVGNLSRYMYVNTFASIHGSFKFFFSCFIFLRCGVSLHAHHTHDRAVAVRVQPQVAPLLCWHQVMLSPSLCLCSASLKPYRL